MSMHLSWRLFDFFEEYDAAALEPAPPSSKDEGSEEAGAEPN